MGASGQPRLVSSSTSDCVASTEKWCWVWATASEAAARAYVRQVRPSWSVCLMLAWFCCWRMKIVLSISLPIDKNKNVIIKYPNQKLRNS